MDHLQNAFHILKNFMVPNPDHHDAMLLKKSRPLEVTANPPIFIMLPAIQLNGDLHLWAVKIQHVLLKRVLTSKTEAVNLPASQMKPEQLLRVGHALSQYASGAK